MLKLLKKEFIALLDLKKWKQLLIEGDFLSFEQCLYEMIMTLYDKISELIILYISRQKSFLKRQRELAEKKGLKKLQLRPCTLYLRTGSQIKINSYYAKKCSKDYEGSRHLALLLWNFRAGASPTLQSVTTLLSVICPSYSMAKYLLSYQGVTCSFDRVRKTSLALSQAVQADRVNAQLAPDESLCDKRVVIGIDGGRCRTRQYKEELSSKGNPRFDTAWREPKMFVIQVIDEEGKNEKTSLPIYDSTFGDDESFDLLEQYLSALQIQNCKEVQFIGDGAKWIWNRAKPMLVSLGVAPDKITETLDY